MAIADRGYLFRHGSETQGEDTPSGNPQQFPLAALTSRYATAHLAYHCILPSKMTSHIPKSHSIA